MWLPSLTQPEPRHRRHVFQSLRSTFQSHVRRTSRLSRQVRYQWHLWVISFVSLVLWMIASGTHLTILDPLTGLRWRRSTASIKPQTLFGFLSHRAGLSTYSTIVICMLCVFICSERCFSSMNKLLLLFTSLYTLKVWQVTTLCCHCVVPDYLSVMLSHFDWQRSVLYCIL